MLQFAEIAKTRPYSVPDKAKQCREDLDAVERAISEVAVPVAVAEAEILKIRQAIERGNALKTADFAQFLEQGGEKLIVELEKSYLINFLVLKSSASKSQIYNNRYKLLRVIYWLFSLRSERKAN